MYKIIELQTDANGNTAHLITSKANQNEAESVFHQILAAAAISNVPVHAATILTENGSEIMHGYYAHGTEPAGQEEET